MSKHDPSVTCEGPTDAHAFDGIPIRPRVANLDVMCPTCHGRGQWNREIDGQGRGIREDCRHCMGLGWLETGKDGIAVPDIVMGPEGHPKWITRMVPPTEQANRKRGSLL